MVGQRTGILVNITQNYTDKNILLAKLIGSSAKVWTVAATAYYDPFRKTRNANVKVNIKRNDGMKRKFKIIVFKED